MNLCWLFGHKWEDIETSVGEIRFYNPTAKTINTITKTFQRCLKCNYVRLTTSFEVVEHISKIKKVN